MSGEAWAPRIVVDFDGVLHSYSTGWVDAETIPDPPVPGAQSWVDDMLTAGWDVVIVSTRAREPGGRRAIVEWLLRHEFAVGLKVQHDKPPALVYLDDRAMRFDGSWPSLKDVQIASVPWTKR